MMWWQQIEPRNRFVGLGSRSGLQGVPDDECAEMLDRRIPDKQTLIEEGAAWQKQRNKNHTKADWQITTLDARIKLKRLYPAI
jgi:hypothetical protein